MIEIKGVYSYNDYKRVVNYYPSFKKSKLFLLVLAAFLSILLLLGLVGYLTNWSVINHDTTRYLVMTVVLAGSLYSLYKLNTSTKTLYNQDKKIKEEKIIRIDVEGISFQSDSVYVKYGFSDIKKTYSNKQDIVIPLMNSHFICIPNYWSRTPNLSNEEILEYINSRLP